MDNQNKTPEFAFNVQRILDCGFVVEEAIFPELNDTLLGYGQGFYFNIEEGWVQFTLRADFSKELNQIFATGTVLTRFGVQNLKSFIDDQGDVIWPPNALETMFGIAFSHLRALFSKNLAGTRFADHILPLINAAKLFKTLIEQDPLYIEGKIKMQPAPNIKSEEKTVTEGIDLAPVRAYKKIKREK